MIGTVLISLLLASEPAAVDEGACMSVAVTTPLGEEAFVGFQANGSHEALARIKAAAEVLGLSPAEPRPDGDRAWMMVTFDDSIVTSEQAVELFNRVQNGDLSTDGSEEIRVSATLLPIATRVNCRN